MTAATVRTRFAPSPTGMLHLGNARTALFNALVAWHAGGEFILRVEDTDRERHREDLLPAIYRDLAWLGLEWQAGPDRGGPSGPYRQAERGEIYREAFARLDGKGLVYPCFCSKVTLEAARRAQRAAGRPPRYPGTCAGLDPADARDRLARGDEATWRFRVPQGREIVFDDLVRGEQRFGTDDIGDFVILRTDGSPAFFFANAVDDARMAITHVLRGEDHVANTPRQLLLLEALEEQPPRYGHVPLVVGEDGGPLSKRSGSLGLAELRAEGVLPLALANYLARLGHSYAEEGFRTDMRALARDFTLERLGRSPARYDAGQLQHWQKEAIAHLDTADLWQWLRESEAGKTLAERVPAGSEQAFADAVRDNLVYPNDALRLAEAVFAPVPAHSPEAEAALVEAGATFFERALEVAEGSYDDFRAFAKAVGALTGTRGRGLFMPLRAALTGDVHGPELARLWPFWTRDMIRSRLRAAAAASQET
ncbi:MAG: glutamate--tRNA ligase [Gammaproteobacteria bacterium]|jgi:glutamyl-tRNA synthetase